MNDNSLIAKRMIENPNGKQASASLSFVIRTSSLLPARSDGVDLMVRVRRFSIAFVLLLMCAGFLPGQTPSASETGIEGVVTISPIKAGPVRADAPSSLSLANATFVVENQKSEIASFTTDAQGRFRMPLAPGHYKVS